MKVLILGFLHFYPEDKFLTHSSFKLLKGENIIGRSVFCDFTLAYPDISDQHCKITLLDGNEFSIEDMNSTHGIYRLTSENTYQRLKPEKEYELTPNKPFYISNKYKCIFQACNFNANRFQEKESLERQKTTELDDHPTLILEEESFPIQSRISEMEEEIEEPLKKEKINLKIEKIKIVGTEEIGIDDGLKKGKKDKKEKIIGSNTNIKLLKVELRLLKTDSSRNRSKIQRTTRSMQDEEKREEDFPKEIVTKSTKLSRKVEQKEKEIKSTEKITKYERELLSSKKSRLSIERGNNREIKVKERSELIPLREKGNKEVKSKKTRKHEKSVDNKIVKSEKEKVPWKIRKIGTEKKPVMLRRSSHLRNEDPEISEDEEEQKPKNKNKISKNSELNEEKKKKLDKSLLKKREGDNTSLSKIKSRATTLKKVKTEQSYKIEESQKSFKGILKSPEKSLYNKGFNSQESTLSKKSQVKNPSEKPLRSQRNSIKEETVEKDLDHKSRHSKRNAVIIMFSGLEMGTKQIEEDKRKIINLGAKIVEEKEKNFTLLVMDKFKRTIKFLLALSKGIDIVNYNWIKESIKEKQLLPAEKYLFVEKKAETKYKFNFPKSLKEAKERNMGLLNKYKIYLSSDLKPSTDEIKLLTESLGGSVVKVKPTSYQEDILIILDENDDKNVKNFGQLGFVPYTTEFIYSAILHQKLDFKKYKIQKLS